VSPPQAVSRTRARVWRPVLLEPLLLPSIRGFQVDSLCHLSPLDRLPEESSSFVSRIARPLLCTDYCTHHSHVPAACHPPRPTPRSPPRTAYLNCCRIELIVSASTSEYSVSTEMRNSASVSVSSTRRAGACRLLEQQRFAARLARRLEDLALDRHARRSLHRVGEHEHRHRKVKYCASSLPQLRRAARRRQGRWWS
jgi:hypothetical protein